VATKAQPKATAAREAQELFFEIGMAERARRGAVLAELGLTFAQAHALRLLDPGRPLPMSKLAKDLVCDASNVTGIADRLEARGLIERQAAEGDRRIKVLALTQEGIETRRQVLQIMAEPSAAISALSPADQRALRDILRRAVELLRSA
jgi:DNA-binding MarR family transcriptional regulator